MQHPDSNPGPQDYESWKQPNAPLSHPKESPAFLVVKVDIAANPTATECKSLFWNPAQQYKVTRPIIHSLA